MNIDEIAARFNGAKKRDKGSYQCLCPIHDDKKASLSISEKDGKILLHCHAGCNTSDILSSVGLTFKDIGSKKKSYKWREKLEYIENKRIEAVYPYYDENGVYQYSKIRFEGKKIIYAVIDEKNNTYKVGKGNIKNTLYRLPELLQAIKNNEPVYIVEGEKDADALSMCGCTATTAGSVSDWKKEYSRFFKGAKVYILPDNDEPGMRLCKQIQKDLKHFAYYSVYTLTSLKSKGDVSDYLSDGHTIEDVRRLIEDAKNDPDRVSWATWIYFDRNKPHINPDLLADAFEKTTNYVQIHNNNDNKEDLYIFKNGVYELCSNNMVESEIRKFIPLGLCNPDMLTKARKLLMTKSRHMKNLDELNTDENYINFKNGLYSIKQKELLPHNPDLLSTIQLDCNYCPDAKNMPVFEKYLNDLCTDTTGIIDDSKKQLLQEWTGLLLSNIPVFKVKQCLILFSPLGNTGKSQYTSLLAGFFDSKFISTVPLDKLGDRFHTSYLQGKRLNVIGDQQHTNITTSSIFKQLTGGDEIISECKGKQATSFKYQGGLVFCCNDLPCFTDDKGEHMFERMCIIPCMNVIPPPERQSNLLQLMLQEKSSIINWALDGLHRLIDNQFHFTECDASKNVLSEYRQNVDTLYRYLSEKCEITGNSSDRIKKTDFENDYIAWCNRNEYNAINKRHIKDRATKNGIICGKVDGHFYYKGVKEKSIFEEIEDENSPFL